MFFVKCKGVGGISSNFGKLLINTFPRNIYFVPEYVDVDNGYYRMTIDRGREIGGGEWGLLV